jgi:ribonuclease P protein component
MLAKKNRLTKSEVECVLKHGALIRTTEFLIRYSAPINPVITDAARAPKFAVIVAKKVEKTSVKRHALKRALYNAIAALVVEFPTTHIHIAISALQTHTTLCARNAYQTVSIPLRKVISTL